MITWLEGKIVEKKLWCDGLYSIKIKTDPLTFQAGQFVIVGLDHNGTRIQKPYSLVSTPSDEFLEIHLNTVKGGEFSHLITGLVVGDTVHVSNRPSGLLTLNEVPKELPHLWFFASGTGIGPFVSILHTEELWQRFEKIVVCYSVRTAEEMAYRGDFEALVARYPDKFQFVPFVTRGTAPDVIHSRLTTFLATGELEERIGLQLTPESSHVMLCGNSAMIKEAMTLLQQKGLQLHNRRGGGNISTEKYF